MDISLSTTNEDELEQTISFYNKRMECPAYDNRLGFDSQGWSKQAPFRTKVGYAFGVKHLYYDLRDNL